ncbi:MAG: hypothetical protein OEY40_06990, partial [Candidatus Bathyarchaeota archaeon]|nr:hypothetical protein [Candidatus Bathyarchaeota archaeon]
KLMCRNVNNAQLKHENRTKTQNNPDTSHDPPSVGGSRKREKPNLGYTMSFPCFSWVLALASTSKASSAPKVSILFAHVKFI